MPGTSASKTSFRREHWSGGSRTSSKTTFSLGKTFSSLGVLGPEKPRCSMSSESLSHPMNVSSSSKTPLKFTWTRTTWSVSKRDRRRMVCLPSPSGISSKPPSLRHRPDRIILGEIRGGEAFDLLQLLNTGHSGSLSTVHATSARQGLARFTSCVLQSGVDLPYRAIKTNVGDSVNVVVHLERRPGRCFVSEVVEIHGYDPDRDEYNYSFIFDSYKEPL